MEKKVVQAKPKPKAKIGRPSKYRPEFAEQVEKLCLLGATDKELANFFEVSEPVLNTWKKLYPEFLKSLKEGKDLADATVAKKLFERATGYKQTIKKLVNGSLQEIDEAFPPDTTAMIFWLKNRQPKYWRDKQEIDHTSSDGSMTPQGLGAFYSDLDKEKK